MRCSLETPLQAMHTCFQCRPRSLRGQRLFRRGDHREIIRAERRGGQSFFVPEIDHRKIRPAITHRHRLGNFRTAYHYAIALNLCFGPHKSAVLTADGKSLERRRLGRAIERAREKPAPHVIKADDCGVVFDFDPFVGRPGIDDFLAIRDATRCQREPRADRFFFGGMNVLLIAHIGDNRHADFGKDLGRDCLGFAQFSPSALRRLILVGHEWRKLHFQEREISLAPIVPPIANHIREQRPILQGASGVGLALQYRTLFADMIRNWRHDWGQGNFTFLEVQLAPFMAYKDQPAESTWAELREAQAIATKVLPKVGMAVITDVGDQKDIHPTKKEPVGARLALAARGITYGEKIVYSGPPYKGIKIKDNTAVISFDHVGGGLLARPLDSSTESAALKGFSICGENRRFVWAKAEIQGDRVVVSSREVSKPVAVRYGWADFPVANLWNKEGLPASPFRTDDFPMITAPKKALAAK